MDAEQKGSKQMSDDHIDGLRKAARRVFWEAKNIEAAKTREIKTAMLDLANWMLRCSYHPTDDAEIPGYSDKPDDYVANYWDGYRDALSEFAYRIRCDHDDEYNSLRENEKRTELKSWHNRTEADVNAWFKSLGLGR